MELKKVAIVLGGTFPHITLIKKLQQRGYYTILIDFYQNPPAKIVADEHIRESTLDKEKVLEIAQERNAKLIIATCIDQANAVACYVAEKLGLPAPYSYEVALNVTNKLLMKKIMVDNGIPTSKFYKLNDISLYNKHNLQFPLIVKPADSNGSKGVRKACDNDELVEFCNNALKISRVNEAIIEEFKEGREIGVDCYIQNNEATVIMTRERVKIESDEDTIQQIYGSFWPADLTPNNLLQIKKIAGKIAKAFSLNNTPLMIQTIVNGDEINVIEFAPRIGGGENYMLIEILTGFDFIGAAINSFWGVPVILNHQTPDFYLFDNYIYAKPGFFGSTSGFEELVKSNVIEYFNLYKAKGTEIGPDITSSNRIGVFVVKSKNARELQEKIKEVVQKIEIYDIDGLPIMRKDIYQLPSFVR